ncbi:NfeD family protein [bacterium]|nr:NfeD family protein [bacterium]
MKWTPELIWFFVGLVLLISEIIVPAVLFLFFGLGAWLVAIVCAFGILPNPNHQLLLFSFASVGFLFSLRKWVKNQFTGYTTDEQNADANLEDFVGEHVKVVETIDADQHTGAVEYKGAKWSALSDNDHPVGKVVKIKAIDGIKLIVE